VSGNAKFKSGSVSYASEDKQMAAFDALPKSIREALANAAFDWAPYPVKLRFERGTKSSKEWIKIIAKWDRDQTTKDAKRVWGIEPERHGNRAEKKQ
jgi:hypothetical protein